MTGAEDERKRAARAEQVALFRYQLIWEAADPALSTRQRGRMVREIASRAHEGPFGDPVTISRGTIDRWIRAWRGGGFAALAPPARQVTLRTDAEVLEMAAGLKRESPARTAAQVRRILVRACGWSPSVRTLQRHFERLELRARPDGTPPEVFGRFECAAPNEMWTGDALHGPGIAGRKVYLFCFLDDHSSGDGRPLGLLRGHRAAGRRAAPGAGRPRMASVPRVPGPKNSTKQKPGREPLEFCRDRHSDVLRFTTDTRIGPTNNISERGVRPLKTQQKISGRLTSDDATQDRLDIPSYIDTARKHGKNAMDVLHDLMLSRPWRPPAQAFSP